MELKSSNITIVGLHGYGIDERQLDTLLLGTGFDLAVDLVTPRAPKAAPEGGFSWFDVSIDAAGLINVDGGQLADAVGHVRQLLIDHQHVRRTGLLALLGYSQGGGLATAAIPHVADLVDAVISIAGFVPGLESAAVPSAAGLPVLLEFGRLDHAIAERDRATALEWAASTGAAVTSHVEAAPHVISAAHRRNITSFLLELGSGNDTRGDIAAPTNYPKGNNIMSNQTINRDGQTLTIVQPFSSSASVQEMWHTAAESWDRFDDWAASLDKVKTSDFAVGSNETGAVRSCETGLGDLAETIVTYDEDAKVFAYQVVEGRPPMVDVMQATWRFAEDNGTATGEVEMKLTLDPGAPEEMFSGMQEQLGGLLGMIAEEFTYYVENGEPHPRKVEAISN